MHKLKEIAVISVLSVSAAIGLAACGGDTTASTPVAPTSAPTVAATVAVDQPTEVVSEPTTEPTAMVAAPTLEPTTEPTAMLGEPTVAATTAPQATTGTGGGTTITGPGADLLNKYFQAFKDVKTYHILQTFEASGSTFTSEGDFQAPDSIRLTTDLGGVGKTESITIGSDTYTKAPGTDTYVHTAAPASATDIKNTNFLPFVESADIIGDETVQGVSTTHLKFVYDADKVMAQTSPGTDLGGTKLGKVTLEIWVDKSNNLPVQQKTDLAAAGTSGSVLQVYSKYNETISPPIEKPANVSEMPAVPSVEIPTVPVP